MNPVSLNSGIDALVNAAQKTSPAKEDKGFGQTLEGMIKQVNQAQVEADHAATGLNAGNAEQLHDVMLKTEYADISMRLLVTMRNKVVDAYQEIMRMQV